MRQVTTILCVRATPKNDLLAYATTPLSSVRVPQFYRLFCFLAFVPTLLAVLPELPLFQVVVHDGGYFPVLRRHFCRTGGVRSRKYSQFLQHRACPWFIVSFVYWPALFAATVAM